MVISSKVVPVIATFWLDDLTLTFTTFFCLLFFPASVKSMENSQILFILATDILKYILTYS